MSSTYSDLIEERTKVAQAVIEADCFPAGMEAFPASGDEQFEYIKKVIDQSDYYVLILGGRYGSRGADGVSFTEKEFNYASSRGLPILVFPHREPSSLPVERRDNDPDSVGLLNEFRARALEGRLAKLWVDADALANQVMRSLLKITREHPRVGWLRASVDQLNQIQDAMQAAVQQRDCLQLEVDRLNAVLAEPTADLSGGDDEVMMEFIYRTQNHRSHWIDATRTAVATWNQMLRSVGPELLEWRSEASVSRDIAKFLARLKGVDSAKALADESMRTLRIQFLALGLIERQRLTTVSSTVDDFWRLTAAGKHQLFKLRPIRKV